MPPDQKRPLDTYYDNDRGRLASYQLEVSWCQYFYLVSATKKEIDNVVE